MATNVGSRSAFGLSRNVLRHCCPRVAAAAAPAARARTITTTRSQATPAAENSSSSSSDDNAGFHRLGEASQPSQQKNQQQSQEQQTSPRPRWSYTPERMKAPFSPHITKKPSRSVWVVNEDPKRLNDMYVRFLGRDGDKMLPEEVKWLAVTHKSFDQGRRGFNDRLAYLGRQAVLLETTRSIVSSSALKESAMVPDEHGRKPFEHPALASIDNLNAELPQEVVSRERIEKLAIETGIDRVLRWKPAKPENLAGSGQQIVLNSAVFAIVGAIMLQHGANVAGRVIRDRVLRPLSVRS